MPSFNRIILAGNLTRDPQLKYLPSGKPCADFGMAVNRKFSVGDDKREEILFIDCTAFDSQAENIGKYLTKGSPALIEGRLKLDQWEDKQGNKRSKHTIIVDSCQFLAFQQGGDDGGGESAKAYPRKVREKPADTSPPFDDEPQFSGDEIPF